MGVDLILKKGNEVYNIGRKHLFKDGQHNSSEQILRELVLKIYHKKAHGVEYDIFELMDDINYYAEKIESIGRWSVVQSLREDGFEVAYG